MRAECHMAFTKLLPIDVEPAFLLPILHNLDDEIGLEYSGGNGSEVPDKDRRRYARLLFVRLWMFFREEGLTEGGAS